MAVNATLTQLRSPTWAIPCQNMFVYLICTTLERSSSDEVVDGVWLGGSVLRDRSSIAESNSSSVLRSPQALRDGSKMFESRHYARDRLNTIFKSLSVLNRVRKLQRDRNAAT